MGKNQKQVIFRLDEDVYCQFKSYLEQRNINMQKALEEAVVKMIEYRETLSHNMQSVLRQLFQNEIDIIKEHLYKACIRSLTLHTSKQYSVKVLVDEFGDIEILETAPGWVPACVNGTKFYVLWEFESINLIQFYQSYRFDLIGDCDKALTPFWEDLIGTGSLSCAEFAAWLRANTEYGALEGFDDEEYLREIAATVGIDEIIDLVCRWNPRALKLYHKWLLALLETTEYGRGGGFAIQHNNGTIETFEPRMYRNLVEYHCLKIIRAILKREEMQFINFAVDIDEGPQMPFTEDELQIIQDLYWDSLLGEGGNKGK
ncbi:MAG: hypothetical protein N2491_03740 [Negativicutes bacterium]|nr:hypothetical protein [Negativicutes bacterium]